MFDIISIGTATQDVFLKLPKNKDAKVCFMEGSKNDVENPVFAFGGGAVNAAVTFARQELKSAVLCRTGDDYWGESLWKELKEESIHSWKIKDKELGTGYATILLSASGERTILTYRGASENLYLKEIPFSEMKTKWVYIVPGHIDVAVMEKIIEHFYYQGVQIAMNFSNFYLEKGAKNLKHFLDKIKVLLINKEEAAFLVGESLSVVETNEGKKAIFKKLDELIKGIVVMTDGLRGVWVSDGKKIYQAGIFKEKNLVDRTGAGDAFGSGFVAGMLLKEDVEYAIRLGSANATAVVEEIGAHITTLTKSQFENDLRWRELSIKVHDAQ